jgi:hypothetical protein
MIMEFNNEPDAADRALADALKSISPASVTIDPLAAAFAAGSRISRRRIRIWQSAAALSLALASAAWLRPQPPTDRSAPLAVRAEPILVSTTDQPISDESVFYLQRAVLQRGLEALPRIANPSPRPVNIEELY